MITLKKKLRVKSVVWGVMLTMGLLSQAHVAYVI